MQAMDLGGIGCLDGINAPGGAGTRTRGISQYHVHITGTGGNEVIARGHNAQHNAL